MPDSQDTIWTQSCIRNVEARKIIEGSKEDIRRRLFELGQVLEGQKESRTLGEYFKGVSADLVRDRTLNFDDFQQYWSRHKRRAALRDVKRRTSTRDRHARDDNTSRQFEDESDIDEILSITDTWDVRSDELEALKDDVRQCLDQDRDFFKLSEASTSFSSAEDELMNGNQVEDTSEDDLVEAVKAFNSVEKDANGAYRVFRKQVLALKLRALEANAGNYCAGKSIKRDSRVIVYVSEKCWSNLPSTAQKSKTTNLARWRGHGEKWLSLVEPSIPMSFRHIPSDHRCFGDFERRRRQTPEFDAVISTLQAVCIIPDLRKLWCRQLIRKRVESEHHPGRCFCKNTDCPETESIGPQQSDPAMTTNAEDLAAQSSHVSITFMPTGGQMRRPSNRSHHSFMRQRHIRSALAGSKRPRTLSDDDDEEERGPSPIVGGVSISLANNNGRPLVSNIPMPSAEMLTSHVPPSHVDPCGALAQQDSCIESMRRAEFFDLMRQTNTADSLSQMNLDLSRQTNTADSLPPVDFDLSQQMNMSDSLQHEFDLMQQSMLMQ
ncbi:hypothetical protein RJZ90_007470 [Blastomyces dermatitidis]